MIIKLSESFLNKQCADLLVSDSEAQSLNSSYILDMDNQFSLVTESSPKKFADYLIESGLSPDITNIYLIMQDINVNESLVVFAHNLASSFNQYYHRKVMVHTPSQLGYDFTLVVPPSKYGEWEVYGIKASSTTKQMDFQPKELIWHGADIIHYMNDSQHTYDGIAYVW